MAYKNKEKQKEFQRLWSREKNRRNREKALAVFGSKCAQCGYDDRLGFSNYIK